jgi:hypothetical protein
MGTGVVFGTQHASCGSLEQLRFTAVTTTAAPETVEEALKELSSAEADPALVLPGLKAAIQVLCRLKDLDLSHITEAT